MRYVLYGVAAYAFIAFLGCMLTHGLWCSPASENCKNTPPPLAYEPSNRGAIGDMEHLCTPFNDIVPLSITTGLNVSTDLLRKCPAPRARRRRPANAL